MDDNRCHSADGTHDETAPAHGTYKRVCYYTNWSQYRSPPGRFTPDDIDPRLCTHIIFAFAKVVNSEIHTIEWNDIQMFEKLNALKNRNPGLKTLIAVGGWNAASNEFTKMVSSVAFRQKFVLSASAFISRYGFDGLDLDWEYPGQRGGKPSDKRNLVKLLQHLHRAFTPKHYLLTAAVPAGKKNVDVGYDVPQLAKYLDFINVMTYDLHGGWERQTGLNSPLYPRTGETGAERELNMQWAANYWVTKGAPRHKLVIGLALYGRSFALTSPARTDVGAPATGPGPKGRYTGEAGFLAYYEICAMQESGKGRTIWQAEQHTPYYVNGNLWVGFDNKRSITEKVKWLMDNKFGGAMVWSLDLDDFRRTCRTSTERYPLLSTVNRLLASGQQPTTPDRRIETTTSRQKNHTVVTTTSSSTTTIHSKTEFTCTGKTDGYYADPSSCKRFYRCIFQRKYEFSCPGTLVFNPNAGFCDWPRNYPYLDFINVMTYDLHGGWERQTGLNSPLYPRTGETGAERELNMQWAANYWVTKGAPRHKLVIGLALYGRSFALTSPARTEVGAPATGPGPKGRYTGEAGFLAYYEICAMQESGKGRTIWQAEQHTPYYVNGNLWVGFDNKRSITEKVKWLMDNKFGGAMVWSLDLDDFRRTCRTSIERYPLLSTVNRLLASGQQPTTPDRRIETTTSRQKNHTVVTTTSSSTTTIHSKTEFTCTGKTDGYYADPSSCKRFYRCIFQRKYEFSCPGTLVFNPNAGFCDWPRNYPCKHL
ncbi:CHIA-like protein [Mya arenaria]|uniref:CHIA-like protein n=1 Tax=Mya arenaria TaxID=6604 RepID=A0ABY7EXT5_MYAAR|nr:CHIA-like protein [Mya arenaria]